MKNQEDESDSDLDEIIQDYKERIGIWWTDSIFLDEAELIRPKYKKKYEDFILEY